MAKKSAPPSNVFLQRPAAAAAPSLDALMARAQALHHAGQLPQAEAIYREVLRRAPRHVDALHSLGLLALQVGAPDGAAQLLAQAIAVDATHADAHGNLGYALHVMGRHAEALASLERALALRPAFVEALGNRGNTLVELGRHDDAIASFDRALELRPDWIEGVYNRGNALHRAGRLDAALAAFDDVIARRADVAAAHNNRGRVLQDLGRPADALAAYERALALAPDHALALVGRGAARLALADAAGALADFDAALRLAPGHAPAHYDRGVALLALRRPADAVDAFTHCLGLAPDHVDARINRGVALLARRRHDDAIADFDAVLAVAPGLAGVACNRGDALLALKRYDEAALAYRRVLALDTHYPYALGKRAHALAMACDWCALPELLAAIDDGLAAGRPTIEPFAYAGFATDPMLQRRCAELFVADQFPAAPALVARGRRYGHAKIRLGYLGGEFRHQATAILAVELFELHARERFELVAFDNGWDDGSALRKRVVAAFDEVVDIATLSDDAAAHEIARREIDILVNLNGFFGLGRTGVFRRRPAPVQVNFLGFPGTMGADCLDAIVADADTIPPGEDDAYTERVVRLPRSYQPNDRRRRIADVVPSRAELGLPGDAFVFACFNNTYKILPETFGAWMRILAAVEGGVLWLLEDNDAATRHLRAAAQAHGIAPARLRFAPRADLDVHLARHAAADLFLDTWPYNAHTTASDALWAGLPVLTRRGTTFAGRVGASLLRGVGLADALVVDDVAAYVSTAIALAGDRARLEAIRGALADARTSAPLFDTPAYCRHLEQAFAALLGT